MGPEQAANPLVQFFPALVIFLIFYILVFKPQKDKQNQQKKLIADLKKNDQVITIGGIHGTVVILKEKTVVIRVDENVRMEIDRDAVASTTNKP